MDCKASFFDGSYHDVDSSEIAFKIAASMAFREAMKNASPVLLEPIMKVVVNTPEEYMGDVMGDLNLAAEEFLDGRDACWARDYSEVPLGKMFGYATDLRSTTKGRASYSMEFECYREVAKGVQEEILSQK